jgi:ubiquinone/menaquinone biosynthesis C-methylase UbiE
MSEDWRQVSRVTRSKAEAKASYDAMSKFYDLLAGLSEKKYKEIGLRKLKVVEGEVILEIGFGTGQCMLALAHSVGDSGKVHGIDISEGMFNVTTSRLRKAGLSDRVELKCDDAAKLPYGSETFDAVFTSFTLELFDTPEIPVVLQECLRVLRKDGRICVVAMSKRGKDNLMVKLYMWAHDKYTRFVDCRPIYVREVLKDAGFRIVDVTEESMFMLPVDIVLAEKNN